MPRLDHAAFESPRPGRPAALYEAISTAWPEHPPYEGAHDTVVPHLTVAESENPALLEALAAQVEPHLPIRRRVDTASLFVEDEGGRWHERVRLPLG